jgi:diguanylate cyclase (GGDEF)-like protein
LKDACDVLLATPQEGVLLSLDLADSSGLATLEAVLGKAPTSAVVVLTPSRDEALGLRAVHLGAQDYLSVDELGTGLLPRCLRLARERQRLLRDLALRDDLTQLYNRRGLMLLAEKKLAEARRLSRPLFLLYADVDGFKHINDTWGHHEGDEALRAVAALLHQTFRASDVIARLGGDEFAVLGVDSAGARSTVLVDRLHRATERENGKRHRAYELSVSVGLRHFHPDEIRVEQAMAEADAAMYAAKHQGHPRS